jgi:Xaa-Pro dipeptidase
MWDEFTAIPFSWELNEKSFNGVLKTGMVFYVESYIGRYDGVSGVKIEEQVLITKNGYELLTSYPFENNLIL